MKKKKLKDLGWANGWAFAEKDYTSLIKKCTDAKHKRNIKYDSRGYEHRVICEECGYIFHYDSSG